MLQMRHTQFFVCLIPIRKSNEANKALSIKLEAFDLFYSENKEFTQLFAQL